jgi:hypothetical protein
MTPEFSVFPPEPPNPATLATPEVPTERTVSELLRDLVEHTQTLAKQELKLAAAELDEKLTKAKAELIAPLLGIAVLYAGLLAIVAALALLLSRALVPWLATAIVGTVTCGIGYALLKRRVSPLDLDLRRNPQNDRNDVQALKEATK